MRDQLSYHSVALDLHCHHGWCEGAATHNRSRHKYYAAGKFGFMTVETARAHAPLCQKYLTKRCGPQCKALHVKYGQLRPSAGLLNAYNAIMAIKSPMSKPPAVPLNPLLVFSGVLLDSGSSLVIDKHHDCEDAYVFRFAEQHIDTRIEQIAEQGWVEVDDGGESKWVNSSNIKAPPLLLHCVKQDYYWMEHAGMSRIIKYCFEIQLNVAVLQP